MGPGGGGPGRRGRALGGTGEPTGLSDEGPGATGVLAPHEAGELLFIGLPYPLIILDGALRVVALNPAAQRLWGLDPSAAAGRPAAEVLHVVTPAPDDPHGLPRAVAEGGPIVAQVVDGDGCSHAVPIRGWRLGVGDGAYAALAVPDQGVIERLPGFPEWALTDPITGVAARTRWAQEFPRRQRRPGVVLFFDLDGLKELNDLYGHATGDRALAVVGEALRALCPAEALPVRYGGDEFIVVWTDGTRGGAELLAQRVAARVAAAAADLPVPVRISYGLAPYEAGAIPRAIREADAAVYEQRGAILRAASGGRIVLTRAARGAVRRPGEDQEAAPGTLSAGFSSDFDQFFRAQYARSSEQAREFVAFAGVSPGMAAVEVGAGWGRITFDGGLANAIGPSGCLLVTDPSRALLHVAQERARREGCGWLRFLVAPAEALPLASGTVDLAIGAIFLHFTDPPRAIREMARIVRPGGSVALSAGLAFPWPPVWEDALQPLREALQRAGRPFRHFLHEPGEIEAWCAGAGLRLERVAYGAPQETTYPTAEIAIGFTRQIAMIRLLARGLPEGQVSALQAAFEDRLRANFRSATAAERSLRPSGVSVVARRP
jgi:diguanylate cyclase (GGDEF)-like protein